MTTTDDLQDLINTNSTCGYELKRLTDRVITSVNEVRNNTPGAAAADVRVIVYKSSIVLNDIPRVTNDCMGELLGNKTNEAAFETRDLLRKTFGVIIDQLIETGTTDMGKDVAQDDYMLKVANMGLVVLSTIDPTGIAYMASQFVQPICGPTAYLGEIDDGTLYDALGLTTVDEAFVGSYGTWAKSGDGVVHLILESVDTEDVSVVVHSGGDKYAEVKVAAGETVTWDSTIPELQDKTMYLDRWRPGILGLPVAIPGSFSDDSVQLSESFGGPHGTDFSDEASVSAGQTIASITIRAGERVDGISLEITGPTAATFSHGGSGGTENTLKLGADEYITSMEAHWGKKNDHTRIFYLSFGTSAGNSVAGGSTTDDKNSVTAPEGFQLGGFFGKGGDEIDLLGAIWTRIAAETAPPATEAPAPPATEAPAPEPATEASAAATDPPAVQVEVTEASAEGTEAPAASTDASAEGTGASVVQVEVTEASTEGTEAPVASTDASAKGTGASAASTDASAESTGASAASTDASAESTGASAASTDASAESTGASAASAAASSAEGTKTLAKIREELADGTEAPAAGTEVQAAATEAPAAPTEAPAPAISVEDSVQLSESFGGPHGTDFSDEAAATSGQTVASITIRAGERVDGISLEITGPTAATFSHGGSGGTENTLKLGADEYITSMEAHWGKKNDHTRIFYLSFGTSAGNSVAGGSMTDDKNSVTAPEGFQLGGFFGKGGDEIDLLGAIWTSIVVVTAPPTEAPTPAPAPGTEEPDFAPGTVVPAGGTTKKVMKAVQLSESFGGPHGNQFSDQAAATSGQTIGSITVRGAKRVDGLTLEVVGPTAATFIHGGTGGTDNTLKLGAGEHITSMEVHWGQRNGHTRIFFLNFGTSAGNSVAVGSQTAEKATITAPEGYQLGGFFGRDGDEIDLLGVVWTSIEVVEDVAMAPVSADEDIVLSEIFGGPHGLAFSDINSIKFGQTLSSITIRAGERVDAVTLQIATPTEKTFNHGGKGGTENTLTLGDGEYITSMEAHSGKKNDHTRVFYLKFGTSAGNFIEAGSKTDGVGTATAPEGFQLSGFYGRAENEVDQLGVIWTRITAKNIELTDTSGIGNGTYGTSIRNWVGPTIGDASDTACYRKTTAYDSNNICPLGYGKDDDDCLARCPLAYPVACGAECIPQNDDCALEVIWKIGSVIAVALNVLSGGVFGQILAAYKTAKWAITCAANVVSVVRSLIYYIRYQQTAAPQGDTEELLTVAYQADVVLIDLPRAICVCLGMPVPKGTEFADTVLQVVEGIVKQAITNGDEILSTGANALSLLTGSGAINKTDATVDELQDLVDKNSSCGYELKRLTDRVRDSVLEVRDKTPGSSAKDIRVVVYKSPIVMNDIPTVTNNCMGELLSSKTLKAAYETRDMLRKTFEVIVDQLIDTGTTDLGESVAEDEYMREVANMGLVVLSTIDPTGIAYMASQFVQPICGPTAYLGEIDDGTLNDALGLTTVDEAFAGSYGSWTKSGDGVVHLIFESTDTKDVTVVVHSGGDDYAEVDVGAGDTVTWDATIPELQDKQMYLDRWRPGILGLPGSGGGSLLLWIPRSSAGGHITMHVRINVS
ncbi:hypothetical protein BBO99_00008753 [Phytophthora kernoviae]|uniref:Jacalin-type lectin domain-containing protein n=1 Tax=Phytophthora kernoviae TaxID=325452 RepID=A0A421FDM9_9STRA|nr:hypothetical protein BBI17_008791 [Phytophthora kernoviae]RLN74769.1 hypothetical protein BBO99_00008753 [Phytophthora kernoviae]